MPKVVASATSVQVDAGPDKAVLDFSLEASQLLSKTFKGNSKVPSDDSEAVRPTKVPDMERFKRL